MGVLELFWIKVQQWTMFVYFEPNFYFVLCFTIQKSGYNKLLSLLLWLYRNVLSYFHFLKCCFEGQQRIANYLSALWVSKFCRHKLQTHKHKYISHIDTYTYTNTHICTLQPLLKIHPWKQITHESVYVCVYISLWFCMAENLPQSIISCEFSY